MQVPFIRVLVLPLLTSFGTLAQTQRFLEVKSYSPESEDAKRNIEMTMIAPTINASRTRLCIITYRHESKTETKELKVSSSTRTSTSTKILNLLTGRLEFSKAGFNISSISNEFWGFDNSAIDGKWIDSKDELKAIQESPRFFFDPQTNTKDLLPPSPGYSIIQPFRSNYFAALVAGKTTSVLLERKGDRYDVKYSFDIFMPKYNLDSTIIYGTELLFTNASKALKTYDAATGKLIKAYYFPVEGSLTNGRQLKDGTWLTLSALSGKSFGQYFGTLFSSDGSSFIRKFSDMSLHYELSDDEKEMVCAMADGTIKAIDLSSGNVLSEVKGTYMKKGDNTNAALRLKKPGTPLNVGHGFVLVPYTTGIMTLFNVKEHKIVANVFVDLDDWAVIASDGRVDGTAGAFEKLEWRDYDGDKIVGRTSLESTFDKYYTPRLLYSLISGEASQSTAGIDIKKDVQGVPELSIERINDQVPSSDQGMATFNSSNKNINVTVQATAHNEKVKEVRMYVNGKLSGIQPKTETGKYVFSVSLNSVFGGKNAIYAIAGTGDGIDSEKSKLLINYSGKEDVKPKMYVLVVGINKYLNPRYELNYALPDASAIKAQLAGSKSALFESVEIKTLFEAQATKVSIAQAFKDLSAIVKEQDMFLFYYAGHGAMNDLGEVQEFYIVPHDVTQMYGNSQLLSDKAISATEIKKMSLSINAQKQIFILDACQSGGALASVATRGAAEERAIGQLARSTGTFWLTAAGSDQFATEFAQLGHGVFTYSLLEALQGKDPRTAVDGTLTIRELSSYVEQRVPELSQKYKGKAQYPSSFSFGNDFPILMVSPK